MSRSSNGARLEVDYNPRMLLDMSSELRRLTAAGGQPPARVFVGAASLLLSTRIETETETVAAIP